MNYPAAFVHRSFKLAKVPPSISGVGRVECFYRLHLGERPNDLLAEPVLRDLDAACSASVGGLPAPEVLLQLFVRSESIVDVHCRQDLFGMLAESMFRTRSYADVIALCSDHAAKDSNLASLRSDYYWVKSQIAIGHLEQAFDLARGHAETRPRFRHIFLRLCALVARSQKKFDLAGRYFVDSAVFAISTGRHFDPPLIGLQFLAKNLSIDTVKVLRKDLSEAYAGRDSGKKTFFIAMSSLAFRLGKIVDSGIYNRAAVDAVASKKIARLKGRILDAPVEAPDFSILGMPKCGTTSAYSYLCKHPHVLPAAKKEIGFFTRDYKCGMDWYRSHFVNAELHSGGRFITGEASPGYFSNLRAIDRIDQHCPKTRLLVFFRNPAARCISSYYQRRKMNGLSVPIKEFFESHFARNGGSDSAFLSSSIYLQQLELWVNKFGRERLLVVNADQLFATPEAVVRDLILFLGLDPDLLNASFPKANVGSYPKASPALLDRLSEFYREPNRRLFEFLGRDFGWNEQRLY